MHPQPLRWRFPGAYHTLITRCQIEGVQAYDITAFVSVLRSGESMLHIMVEGKSHTWERVCHDGELEHVTDPIIEFFHDVASEACKVVSEGYLTEMNRRQV